MIHPRRQPVAELATATQAATQPDDESTAKWGGTTALSGGGWWIPANPLIAVQLVPGDLGTKGGLLTDAATPLAPPPGRCRYATGGG